MTTKKILVVSDQEKFANSLKANFEKEGHETQLEMAADQVMAKLVAFRPDVVVIDITNPEYNACEAIIQLQETPNPKLSKLLVLYMSDFATKNESEIYCGLVAGHPFTAKPAFRKTDKVKDLLKYMERVMTPPPETPA